MGAWIETDEKSMSITINEVAPYVGAWIETARIEGKRIETVSHPTWVRGLKQLSLNLSNYVLCRTLRGCVD